MENKQKLNLVLDYIINGEQDKASSTIHEIIVDKSKRIYNETLSKEDESLDVDLDEDVSSDAKTFVVDSTLILEDKKEDLEMNIVSESVEDAETSFYRSVFSNFPNCVDVHINKINEAARAYEAEAAYVVYVYTDSEEEQERVSTELESFGDNVLHLDDYAVSVMLPTGEADSEEDAVRQTQEYLKREGLAEDYKNVEAMQSMDGETIEFNNYEDWRRYVEDELGAELEGSEEFMMAYVPGSDPEHSTTGNLDKRIEVGTWDKAQGGIAKDPNSENYEFGDYSDDYDLHGIGDMGIEDEFVESFMRKLDELQEATQFTTEVPDTGQSSEQGKYAGTQDNSEGFTPEKESPYTVAPDKRTSVSEPTEFGSPENGEKGDKASNPNDKTPEDNVDVKPKKSKEPVKKPSGEGNTSSPMRGVRKQKD